jgi:cellobiose phosphorylase
MHSSRSSTTDRNVSDGGRREGQGQAGSTACGVESVKLLSNGRYHVMLSADGGGYSRHGQIALTRWREDATRDCWGAWLYLRDRENGDTWSLSRQPVVNAPVDRRVDFSGPGASFEGRAFGIEARVDVAVAPGDDLEVRKVSVTNRSSKPRTLDLTTYAEVVLSSAPADNAHPAFNKLFVQTDIAESPRAILCHRRPGNGGDPAPWLCHAVVAGEPAGAISCETDRARFIGRGRTLANPAANQADTLSGTCGSVLDPVLSIRCPVVLQPGQSATVSFLLGVADDRAACESLIGKYQTQADVDRAIDDAAGSRKAALAALGVDDAAAALYDRLAAFVAYGNARLRADPSDIMANRQGQSGLWGFSVSGDFPIIFLQIGASPNLARVRELLQAHAYWRYMGLAADLVIANAKGLDPRQDIQQQVLDLVKSLGRADQLDQRGGIFVRLASRFAPEDRTLFLAVARVVLDDGPKGLADRLGPEANHGGTAGAQQEPSGRQAPARADSPATALPHPDLMLENGLGGFTPDGREYVMTLGAGATTPTPWTNVLANPDFGTIVSESGCANTWSENAHEFRLTPWSNDPVCDSSGEAVYLRDDSSGECWSPSPWPCRDADTYVCRHGFGYSSFQHVHDGLESDLVIYVARGKPVKFAALTVRNRSGRTRRLSATGYVEWVLGDQRIKTMAQVTTRLSPDGRGIVAHNAYSMEFGDRHAFFSVNAEPGSVTADRTEFLGSCGSAGQPAAMARPALSGAVGAALDPCAALRVPFELEPDTEREIVFMLGAGAGEAGALGLLEQCGEAGAARAALDDVQGYWRHTLDAVRVKTPDPAFDTQANGWLAYQALACRVWARSAFYQPGGAFGFRDQLQDVMALVHAEPALVRAHILLSASRQYPEGDVQHWWHPPMGRGVRTRCCDDYLWLALATCRYIAVTGDASLLDEPVLFLEGRPLKPDEESYYELPGVSKEPASLYDHCVRAIRHGFRMGAHGLPLMGTGDWNDGMNKVGAQGKGESVWMAFFLYRILQQFKPLAQSRGDAGFVKECDEVAAGLVESIARNGWDGEWFVRAYFDDGTPLGSAKNDECRMGSIAQSWSVLSGAAEPERARQAMDSLDRLLVDRDNALIKLLSPPFDVSVPDPGYIRAYVPGVRENGGQYTHAAVWAAMAFAELRDSRRAAELTAMLNPVNHALDAAAVDKYKVEPFVVASDVYALPPHTGRGGWTWYSGSAGWLYRLLLESVLGLQREADTLYLRPCVPDHWDGFSIDYRYGATVYHVQAHREGAGADKSSRPGGAVMPGEPIPLVDDGGEHQVRLVLPGTQGPARPG